jgi:hypothetical protein
MPQFEFLLPTDTVEKLDFLPRSQFPRQQAGFKKKALWVSAERLIFRCAAAVANWRRQRVALSALHDQIPIFWRPSFSEFFGGSGEPGKTASKNYAIVAYPIPLKNSVSGDKPKFGGPCAWASKKDLGGAEVGVEVAGDHRSYAAVALNTGFCSECHLIEFLRQSDFGLFQQYRPFAGVRLSVLDDRSWAERTLPRTAQRTAAHHFILNFFAGDILSMINNFGFFQYFFRQSQIFHATLRHAFDFPRFRYHSF